MRAFTCGRCGSRIFFENTVCLACGAALGFSPEKGLLLADSSLSRCANAGLAGCNWLVADPETDEGLCRSCRLTRTRPDDSDTEALAAFLDAEAAKRRLVFQLLDLGLPIDGNLAFDLLSSRGGPVTTGHADGVITLDLAESNNAHRERVREQLGEPYRTLLGHLRHEIGHYYLPLLAPEGPDRDAFRSLFGDERADYAVALEHHYAEGPGDGDWGDQYVSAYATAHPHEDWAETFAHYLHIRDTLQTAAAYGVLVVGGADPTLWAAPAEDVTTGGFDDVLEQWLPLTYALNAINRSMGKDDLYPFVLSPTVVDKLAFVHRLVGGDG